MGVISIASDAQPAPVNIVDDILRPARTIR